MQVVEPCAALVELIEPYGRPPFALETMLRIHFIQSWFRLSNQAMEEACHGQVFFNTPLYREFAQLDAHGRLPDESTILRFRHRLERHKLADQTLAQSTTCWSNAACCSRPARQSTPRSFLHSATKNKSKEAIPRCISQKGKQWYFGIKAHIGVDADSGLVHTVHTAHRGQQLDPRRRNQRLW